MWRHLLLNGRLWKFTAQKASIKSIGVHASGTNRPIWRGTWFFPPLQNHRDFSHCLRFGVPWWQILAPIDQNVCSGIKASRLLLQSYAFHFDVNHSKEFLHLLRHHNHICVAICLIAFCWYSWKDLIVVHEIQHRAEFNWQSWDWTCGKLFEIKRSVLKREMIIVSFNWDFPN